MNAASPPSGFESCFEWTAGGMIDPDTAPAGQWAAIAALADLQKQRDEMRSRLSSQRGQLAALVRAAYQLGDDAPL